MKKVMILLVGMMFTFSATAATVSLQSSTYTGGGSVADGSGVGGATGTHTDIQGNFEDVWLVNSSVPLSETFNIVTSTPTITTFDGFYSLDGGSTWVDFVSEAINPGVNESEFQTLTGALTSYLIKVTGSGIVLGATSYLVSVQDMSAVPVPAALFLFAPALLGFMGLRRKLAAV